MTATVSEDKLYEDHAALLGRVTLAWNDCHYMVLLIFNVVSDEGWEKACTKFFDQPSDHNRRGITRTRMKEVLNTKNDEPIREKGTQLLDALDTLAKERNLATHTMWASVPIHTMWTVGTPKNEIRPHPAVPKPENLEEDFEAQFTSLTTKLSSLLWELELYESALAVHLEISRARAQENVAALESGNRA
jgi:hypothetical protein